MPSSNPNSINARRVESENADERAAIRKARIDKALASKPGFDGFAEGDEVLSKVESDGGGPKEG